MRKILFLLFLALALSGCATYKFQKSGSSANQGYLVAYDGKPVPEYTIGKDKSLPDLPLAKQRFKRRRAKVEYYYKKTGQIESRAKEFLWDAPVMFVDFIWGVVRWPFIAYSDYKYNRDPKYKERVDRLDEQKDELERARINTLKAKLNAYIQEDLDKESSAQGEALPLAQAAASHEPEPEVASLAPAVPQLPAAVVTAKQPSVPEPRTKKAKPVAARKKPATKPASEPPVAVIIARPVKGYSPLKVNFYGHKSHSKSGRIVSYDWDFGDGDTSTKKNPENTYWSTTYGVRNFTATLTVRDDAGNISRASTVIEVATH